MLPAVATVALIVWTALLPSGTAGWKTGRATYYGAPESISKAYDPTRGDGSFGILAYGSCGYTNVPSGSLPFPKDQYAALADAADDFPGSCGRCYEIRCKSGLVLGNTQQPIQLVSGGDGTNVKYFDGDYMRPYLASIDPTVRDTQGRSYPGNPAQASGQVYTQCYDENKSLLIRITDSCPCKQVLPDGAPGVKRGGEIRRQEWCCGPTQHFDLSYWAFEQLAHPVSGVMMLEYRPVDCDSRQAIPQKYISPLVYSLYRGIEPGWGWKTDKAVSANLKQDGAPYGGVSACARLAKGGDMSFMAREAARQGFQPFKGKSKLTFWMRNNEANPYKAPALKVFLMADNDGKQQYCFKEWHMQESGIAPDSMDGAWARYQVSLATTFVCDGALDPNQLNRVDFQNVSDGEVDFCATGIELQ